MELWHLTDQHGRDGIEAEGFQVLVDGPPPGSPDHGMAWFAATRTTARAHTHRRGWWVRVVAPDDLEEYDLGTDLAGHGLYRVPIEQANLFPREFEREAGRPAG